MLLLLPRYDLELNFYRSKALTDKLGLRENCKESIICIRRMPPFCEQSLKWPSKIQKDNTQVKQTP